jgi:hypothetical protein
MKSNRASRILAFVLGLVVMAVAVGMMSGCGDQPLAPVDETASTDRPTAAGGGAKLDKLSTKLVKLADKEVKKLIGPLGDTLDVCLNGRGRKTGLIVPPSAVLQLTLLEMKVVECRYRVSGMIYEYDFGPDGQQFGVPCTLFLEHSGRAGTLFTLWWFNPQSGEWEPQRTEALEDGKVSFRAVNHFSKYGITVRGGGGAS